MVFTTRHPDHPAQWSKTDFAEAHWLGCSYVITAIESGTAKVTNSFLLKGTSEDEKHFEDEALELDVTGVEDSAAREAAKMSTDVHEGEKA